MRLLLKLAMLLAVVGGLGVLAQGSYVNFETVPVRPLALSPDGNTLYAVNTPDNRLEIFDILDSGLLLRASVPVGLEPVAVAARTDTEVWVVNHLSDSVSVIDTGVTPPTVVRTLLVGDEPWDIVFAGPTALPADPFPRAFIAAARRGQGHVDDTRSEIATPGQGRADVWVFDAGNLGTDLGGTPETVLTFFGDKPRALAATPDGSSVYVAVFHSGNQTTAINEGGVCDGFDPNQPCTVAIGTDATPIVAPGGLPAPDQNIFGDPAPEVGLIVKWSPGAASFQDELGRDWNSLVPFRLPDRDVFEIDALSTPPAAVPSGIFTGVGTILYAMATHPDGRIFVANTEARNEVRFEGPGSISTTVRGHIHEARISVLGAAPPVKPRHLNKHLNYGAVTVPPAVKANSLATPVGLALSDDASTLFVAAFGSQKIGVFDTAEIDDNSFVPDVASHIPLSGGGPSGLVYDGGRGLLYVATRFDNAIKTIDVLSSTEIASNDLFNPEPPVVTNGRSFLYDAVATSANGEASCGACHVFGDFDSLAWDLGNPDGQQVTNENPFRLPGGTGVFHPMKGPMTTQTFRGMSHQGPMHWRGDRSAATASNPNLAFDEVAAFEAFNVAFGGLVGREGPDEGQIPAADMTDFALFALTVFPQPNPYRNLDNSLLPSELAGRTFFFNEPVDAGVLTCEFCHRLAPQNGSFGTDGRSSFEGETQEFKIAPLRNLYDKIGMFGTTNGAYSPNAFGDQIRGFGFLHNGSAATVMDFLSAAVFTFPSNADRQNVADFMHVFDGNLAPIVGQQITLRHDSLPVVGARIDLLEQQARAAFPSADFTGSVNECELIAKGFAGGHLTAYQYDPASDEYYVADPGSTISRTALEALVVGPGDELTFSCVYPQGGQRIGRDRDDDGIVDGAECGDANGDGVVTSDDATHVGRQLAGIANVPFVNKCNSIGAPGGGLAECDILDRVIIARAAAGLLPEPQPVCAPVLP